MRNPKMPHLVLHLSLASAALLFPVLSPLWAGSETAKDGLGALGKDQAGQGGASGSAAALPFRNEVKISTAAGFRTIESNGWPEETPKFPRRGNPHTAKPQHYQFRVPVQPKAQEHPVRAGGYWWGVALNGVPFEPGTGETWQNNPQSGWRYEAATGFLDLGLDEHHAHVQPTGAYHYHALPVGLVGQLGGDGATMRLIGWAADGFPLYSGYAHKVPADPKSPLGAMKSSYRLKAGNRPAQADGPGGKYDGRFTQDFEFVPGSGDLDECNGRSGVTPEFPQGTYYYCVTAAFPFVPRLWRGEPDQSFFKNDRPPGGGPPGRGGAGAGPGAGPGLERRPPPPPVQVMDRNGDGALDADELAKAPESLLLLDQNKDGKLSGEELRPSPPPGGTGPPPGGPGPE